VQITMKMRRRDVLKASGMAFAGAVTSKLIDRPLFAQSNASIERDVCVIGGGSAGTYVSVRLGDYGKSVVILERTGRLGGHAETYIVPGLGVPIDIGVVDFEATPVVENYFDRFKVNYVPSPTSGGTSVNVDLRTGLPLSNYTPPSEAAIGAALSTYYEILATKYPYLDAGFQLPDPVPQELAEPFSNFVTTYGLQALVPTIFEYAQGAGNLLQDPALYVLKLFSLSVVQALFGAGFLNLPAGTAQLYTAAAQYLGANVIFNAGLRSVKRTGSKIQVLADTPAGPVTIHCGKLIWSAPPTLLNLAPVDLDSLEISVFSKLQAKCYTTGLATISGLPENVSINNLAANTPYNLPPLPGLYTLQPTVPGLYLAFFGAQEPLPSPAVEALIQLQVESLSRAGTYPARFEGFQIFSNHSPFQLGVTGEQIGAGFYTQMNSLQGRHDTYYNGAAFQTNDSSLIWQFTEELLPQILA
jgi:hypothetical protein